MSLTPLPESAEGLEGLLGMVAVLAIAAPPEYRLYRGVLPLLITQSTHSEYVRKDYQVAGLLGLGRGKRTKRVLV